MAADYSYESELAGLADYLGEFGLGATPQTPQQARKAQLDAQMKAAQARQAAASQAAAKKTAAKPVTKTTPKVTPKVTPKPAAAKQTVPAGPNPYGIVLPKAAPAVAPAAQLRTAPFANTQAAGSASLLTTSIASVQQILNLFGAKLKVGGAFPGTQAAWQRAASGKGLSPAIENAGGTQVRVNRDTYASLSAGPAKKQTPTKAAAPTTSAKAPAASAPASATKLAVQAKAAPIKAVAAEKPSAPSRADLVKASVGTAQDIVRKLGAKITRDGKFGTATKNAWAQRAKAKKVDGVFDRAGPTEAWVDQTAFATLSKAAGFGGAQPSGGAPPSADPESGGTPTATPAAQLPTGGEDPQIAGVVRASTVATPVLAIQQALMGTNLVPAAAGLYANVSETGTWDSATEAGMLRVLGLTGEAAAIMQKAIPQLLSADRGTIMLVPAANARLMPAAVAYQKMKAQQEPKNEGINPAGGPPPAGSDVLPPDDAAPRETPRQGEQQNVDGRVRRQRLRLVPPPSGGTVPDPVDTNPEIPTPAPTPMPGSPPAVFITAPAPEQQTIPIYNNTTTSDTTTTTTTDSSSNYNVPLLVGAGVLAVLAFMHGKSGAGASRGAT